MCRRLSVLLALACVSALAAPASDIPAAIEGGLVVHVGCGDGQRTAALRVNKSTLVHGLDASAANVAKARAHIHSKGIYGPVSVALWQGDALPYVNGLVNVLVCEDVKVSKEEILRVLAPEGMAFVGKGDAWTKTVKPPREGADDWSHFLHDSGGNAVAEDREIGSPKRLRWTSGPRWCRTHEFPSSVNSVIMADGRLFTIFDEGPTGIYKKVPQKCMLVARDANSGVLLWKVPTRNWQPVHGTGTGNRWQMHHTIPRRLVAGGGRVYVTLEFLNSPVTVLDAATGKTVAVLKGTEGADELILSDGVLIAKLTKKLSVGAQARVTKAALDDTLTAIDAKTGKALWRREGIRVVPYALSAKAGRVIYHDMDELVCVDARTGKDAWRAANPITSTVGGGSTLVIKDGVVLFHGHGQATPPPKTAPGQKPKKGRNPRAKLLLTALSLEDGKPMWQASGGRGQAAACTQPTDVFVTNGVVWCGGSLQGRDLKTGEVKKTLAIGKTVSPGHHYRCFRSKATERFLIWPKRGAEFLDVEGDDHMRNDWLRAPCMTGLTPANGLLYVPPSQCFCYPGVLVSGFLAMSAEPADELKPSTEANLEKGPAFGKVQAPGKPSAGDWPVYRRDARRSGSTKGTAPAKLDEQWAVKLACKGSPPVVVGDRLWLAEKDAHRIRCLDAATGKDIWAYTAGGRVDSPPTIHEGMVLFGSCDGFVTCLRAADGELVWRFRAAPTDRRIVSFEQVESAWPVHGSVLVQDGVVYFAAGRSSYLDGGILVYGLDAKSGNPLYSHVLDGPWPDVKTETGKPFAMEGALPDLIVSDGKDLYMRRIKFDAKLNRIEAKWESQLGELDMGANHLAATGGFLDDTGFDRLYWMYSKRWPGFYFSQHSSKAGQLVVFDETTTYAVKHFFRRIIWSPVFHPGEQGSLVFADDNDNEPGFLEKGQKDPKLQWLPKGAYTDAYRRGGRGAEKATGYVRKQPAKWQGIHPLRARAMVLAGDRLVLAGPPDVLPKDDPLAAFEGRAGAVLQVLSAADGKVVAKKALDCVPAFDGVIAARGRLYMSTEDGRLLCLGGE